jgi:phosphopantothenoylcysteine decarboxylase
MANILLGLTGSVASIKAPELYRGLASLGHTVRAVATSKAVHFFDPKTLDGVARDYRDPGICLLDEDEWKLPKDSQSPGWTRGEPVLHIELRRWADLFLLAPLDALTLSKIALGIPDNCLTCVWRAWDPEKPRIIAPAMNTFMWEHPATRRHLVQVFQDSGDPFSYELTLTQIIGRHPEGKLFLASPETKLLACGDEGMGGMASIPSILDLVKNCLKA